jgi:uncharacterized protein
MSKSQTFYVDGMHCQACELLIKKKISEKYKQVNSINIELENNKIDILSSDKSAIQIEQLNKDFAELGYSFSNKVLGSTIQPLFQIKNNELIINNTKLKKYLTIGIITIIVFGIVIMFERMGLIYNMTLSTSSSLFAIFVFGIFAGISSCAALVGGVLLAMTKRWNEKYILEDSKLLKLQPFIFFNLSRLLAFAIFGGLLGFIGKSLGINSVGNTQTISVLIVIVVSIIMLIIGLQMLGIKFFQKIKFALPKFITQYISNENNFDSKYAPILLGMSTFFYPCGFTIIAQGVALTSANIFSGAMIMLFFALGTLPILAFISISSVFVSAKPQFNYYFTKSVSLIIIFFALFNINSQLNVLGLPSLSNLNIYFSQDDSDLTIDSVDEGEYQILRITANSRAYTPANTVVQANKPIKWEIADVGTSGCSNAIISKDLLGSDQIDLEPGINVVELPALQPGIYKYSCWMGMINGTIRAI